MENELNMAIHMQKNGNKEEKQKIVELQSLIE